MDFLLASLHVMNILLETCLLEVKKHSKLSTISYNFILHYHNTLMIDSINMQGLNYVQWSKPCFRTRCCSLSKEIPCLLNVQKSLPTMLFLPP